MINTCWSDLLLMEAVATGTHCVDPRELLRELQKDGNDNGLAVDWRAEELQDGDLPLHLHLPLLLLHLRQHVAHIQPPCQPLKTCTNACMRARCHEFSLPEEVKQLREPSPLLAWCSWQRTM